MRETISEFESVDNELRDRIAELERLLVVERQKAGQELMSRILELESLLEVERRRVAEMPEISEIAQIDVKKMAANSKNVKETKKKLARKLG